MSKTNYEFKRKLKHVFSAYKAMHTHSMAGCQREVHTLACSKLSILWSTLNPAINCLASVSQALMFN